jgi:uroporphyrinogen decarboxylase
MTPRQRWVALLEGRRPDRIPTDYQATAEVTARLLRDLECDDEESLWRRLHIDKRMEISPRSKRPNGSDDLQTDMWGVDYTNVDYGTGHYLTPVHHPLADVESVDDVHKFPWPDPDDFDYAAVTEAADASDGYYPIHAGYFEPFLRYGYMRGLERAYMDLVLHEEIAEATLGRIFDFHYEHNGRIFAAGAGRIDTTYVAEDLGSQTGALMSLEMYRRFLLPNQIRMADLARSFGISVMYHTDGAARQFLPDLIDRVGIDILNPIQWRCPGMDREGLVRDFGERIIFHGSIDNQQTLAFGSVDDVTAEVRESIEIYRLARWICAPCHNIQPISPTDNIVAMYETIHEHGGC